jgi:formyltetrahydrofolate deformylase
MSDHLLLSCPDRPGIVSAVTGFLAAREFNIVELDQFSESGELVMRVAFDHEGSHEHIEDAFAEEVGKPLDAKWRIEHADRLRKVVLMASREDHCLHDILSRASRKEILAEVTAVISNHPDAAALAESHQVPFHHLAVGKETKASAEKAALDLMRADPPELVILARYMQILSPEFLAGIEEIGAAVINIHHSFLPAFPGARPYHSAHARGVKIIGATSHYVTEELDEGPIIAQAVEPTTHVDQPDVMTAKGRDTEARVLARAVKLHLEGRIFLNGGRTVVFE